MYNTFQHTDGTWFVAWQANEEDEVVAHSRAPHLPLEVAQDLAREFNTFNDENESD